MKKTVVWVLLIVLAIVSATALAEPNRIISFDADSYVVYVGKQQKITSTVERTDDGAPKQTTLVWTSSDESIAKVNTNGSVTGVSAGTVEIQAHAKDDETISKTVTVEVRTPVSKLTMDRKEATLLVGSDEDLAKAELKYEVAPEEAYHKDVTWKSSNEKVATVDENGIVTALSKGNAIITATSGDPSVEKKTTCQITVVQAVTALSFDSDAFNLPVPKTVQVKTTIEPANAGNKKLIWTSSDESIATVSATGIIKGVSSGIAVITAITADGSGISASCTVTVVMPVKKITIDTNKVVLPPNVEWQLSASPEPETASIKELAWKSSNEEVASVSQDGLIKAHKVGNCKITASAVDGSNVTASVSIEVKNFDVVITQKGAVRVSFDTHESSGYTTIVSNGWSYSGPFSIKVKISNGCVTTTNNNGELMPVKPGTDTITVTRKYGRSNKKTYSIYVGQEILAPARIVDLGFGKGAIILEGSEGVFNDHSYKIFYGRYTWAEAKKMCEKEGGHLVTITSSEEQKFLEKLNSNKKALWIGFERVQKDSENWRWITDESNEYNHWNSGEPNNYNGAESKASIRGDGRWNDLNEKSSEESDGFICEWDEIPEGTNVIRE